MYLKPPSSGSSELDDKEDSELSVGGLEDEVTGGRRKFIIREEINFHNGRSIIIQFYI